MSTPDESPAPHNHLDNRGANIAKQENHFGPRKATLADLRARAVPYLRTLAAKCRRLPLRGLDSKANDPSAEGIFPTGKTHEGIFDMTGNVWEWCASRYVDKTKDASLPVADLENTSDWQSDKAGVVRGGSWGFNDPGILRASYRIISGPGGRSHYGGFRVMVVAAAR